MANIPASGLINANGDYDFPVDFPGGTELALSVTGTFGGGVVKVLHDNGNAWVSLTDHNAGDAVITKSAAFHLAINMPPSPSGASKKLRLSVSGASSPAIYVACQPIGPKAS